MWTRVSNPRTAARGLAAAALAVLAALGTASCASDTISTGDSSVYLVVTRFEAAPGGSEGSFDSKLSSDVITSGTVFEDLGRIGLALGRKNVNAPLSENNQVTINRYRVTFARADGRNTPGVDVPYPFDGAVTFTVTETGSNGTFLLVRPQAKLEPPLIGLRGGGGAIAITTLAEVTFYGRDQVGNDVSATASMTVTFADYGD
jgi:hypothetical protein